MTRQNQFGGRTRPRQDRRIEERVHDTYKPEEKLPEPTHCPGCGAVYRQGRWQWAEAAAGSNETLCAACKRIRDRYPAGYVRLSGAFLTEHETEIRHLIDNLETKEKGEHPTERLMEIRSVEDGIEVTTTGMRLARAIGEALERAYEGDMSYRYNDADAMLRVSWRRDS